jgi:hypothetical protein
MIDLSNLRRLLVSEFNEAETVVRQFACRALPQVQETEITAVFGVEVERRLQSASDDGRIANAVLRDLENAFQRSGVAPGNSLTNVTNGLVARVVRHRPAEEKRDGGDFGLVMVEPIFRFRWHNHLDIERGGRKNGLLVQAKRRPYGQAWNQLTETQEQVLGARMPYAALLRYEFDDDGNTQLKNFRWNALAGVTVAELISWLRSGTFPSSVDTSELVAGVSLGRYGTSDPEIIKEDICSDAGAFLIVEVDWKDDDDPSQALLRLNRDLTLTHTSQAEVRIKIGH